MEGIYIASRATEDYAATWRRLREEHRVPITCTWIDEVGKGESDYTELWPRIAEEIRNSFGLILYAAKDDFPLKGAFIEAGMALAMGKPVVCVLPDVVLEKHTCRPIGSWIRHPNVRVVSTVTAAITFILAMMPAPAVPKTLLDCDLQPKKEAFEGGATRSSKRGQGRMEPIPKSSIRAMARRLELGAERHGENNWRKGGEAFRKATLNHLLDHIFDYMEHGNKNEANTDAIICNAAFLCEYEEREPYKGAVQS